MPTIIIDQNERYPEYEISPSTDPKSRNSVEVSVSTYRLRKWKRAIAEFEATQKEMAAVVKKELGGVEIKLPRRMDDPPPIPPHRKPFVRDDNSQQPPLGTDNPAPRIKEGPAVPYSGFSPQEKKALKKLRKEPLPPPQAKKQK